MIIHQFHEIDPKDLKLFLNFVRKDKFFMNDIIEKLSESNTEFSSQILAYAIEKYEADYGKLLNNILVPGKLTEALNQEYKNKDILGQIQGKNDYTFCLSGSQEIDESTLDAGILRVRRDCLEQEENGNSDQSDSSDDEAIEVKLKSVW